MAIAGDQIAAEGLSPAPEAYPLFVGWQITVTATPDALTLEAFGLTRPDRHAAAYAALQAVVQQWQAGVSQAGDEGRYRFALAELNPPQEAGGVSGGHLTIEFPRAANGALLARLLSPRVDWVLLQTVLTQLAPSVERQTDLVWQQVTLTQPLDLRAASRQWLGVATGLEEQAAAFETAGEAQSAEDVAGAEGALRARIQAVNYRAAAQEWRQLARQSWLLYTLAVDDSAFAGPVFAGLGKPAPARTWAVTPDSAPQMFVFQTQVLNLNRALTLGILAVLGLVGTAGTLWWLL